MQLPGLGDTVTALERIFTWLPEDQRGPAATGTAWVIIVLVLLGMAAIVRRLFRAPKQGSDVQPAPPSLPTAAPKSVEEIEAAVFEGRLKREEAEWLVARLETRRAAAGEPPLPAESREAFVEAALDISEEGDAAEREALALFAEGDFDAANARLESDLQQAAGQAIEKLRRKGALFAPVDTHVAKDAYERLLALAPDDLHARNELGHLLLRLGELDAADAAYRAVLDGAGDDKTWKAHALGNLGLIAQTRGDLDAAEASHRQSLAMHEALGGKRLMAIQLGNLGLIAQDRGYLDAAEDYHRRSLELHGALGDKVGIATALGNLGGIALTRGDLNAAETFLCQSLEIDEALGHKEGMANQIGNLGLIAQVRGDFDAAEDYLRQSLELHSVLGHKVGIATALCNLGEIALARGDLDAAETYCRQSLEIEEALGRKEGMAADLCNLGVIAQARGNRAEARRLLGRARELYAEMGASEGEGGRFVAEALAALEGDEA